MAKKQRDYLADLLADEAGPGVTSPLPPFDADGKSTSDPSIRLDDAEATPSPTGPNEDKRSRERGMTLLGRENALARVATGEVRQVTQLLLDPARVRVWPGNARSYEHLTEESCRELINSIIAEGGQKVPAIVRRVEGDQAHDYEVIAGTRRHWSIRWLRTHSYPEMKFVAQVADLDDEAAFRLADLENRARQDVSDLERARNYAAALKDHYGNHMSRMAERLKLSKGWLSKMLKVAKIPDEVIAAFASPADVQLKPAYPLAQALDDTKRATAIRREASTLAKEQARLRDADDTPLPSPTVLARLLGSGADIGEKRRFVLNGPQGRPALTVQSANRQGVTLRLHSGHGLSDGDLLQLIEEALTALKDDGRGLQR